jgi:thioredoxin 1
VPRGAYETFTDATWEREVMGSRVPVLVHFFADWCVPCRTVGRSLEVLATEHASRLRMGGLDVEENAATAERYTIQGLPTLLLIDGGQVVERRVGLMAPEALRHFVEDRAIPGSGHRS